LTFEISPAVLYELGLEAALEWLAEKFEKKNSIPVSLNFIGSENELEIDQKILLFITVRGLIQNAVKDSDTDKVDVFVEIRRDGSSITVVDDKKGVIHEAQGLDGGMKNFDLFGIQEQVHHHGGRMNIDAAPGGPTRIKVYLPIAPRQILSKKER